MKQKVEQQMNIQNNFGSSAKIAAWFQPLHHKVVGPLD